MDSKVPVGRAYVNFKGEYLDSTISEMNDSIANQSPNLSNCVRGVSSGFP